ncbi:hypothetical protein SEA_BANTAM_118 [Gordonia phage Bantam]|uniref:dATP/dGTP diphosphohydrolase N-terminal domain-containing protein n=1 Tax=Gordonia phage Bantam TaxID=1887641 RepID=A0A1B3AYJ7_9CAUD|nr:hypothetical protein BIZ77_gp061 [Gordonia phage Bantam]AOE43807.1 hypothetical protein SEA_BANTAM_118 [Gordonia phage Bantam]
MSTLTGEEVRQTSSTGAQKGQKIQRVDLLPVGPLLKVAEHYGRGAEKYAERNWEAGYDWSLSYQSMMRHALQFWAGEDIDEEIGTPHLAAVIFHALALLEFMETHREFDNRPSVKSKKSAGAMPKVATSGLWDTPGRAPGNVVCLVDEYGWHWRRIDGRWYHAATKKIAPGHPEFWDMSSWTPAGDLEDHMWAYRKPFRAVGIAEGLTP